MISCLLRLHYMTLWIGMILVLGAPNEASALTWNMPPVEFTVTDPVFTNIDLAADPSGNAFSLWVENGELLVSRFSAVTETYGPSEVLYTGNPIELDIATDATGTAIAVWKDATTGDLLSSHFNGVSWTAILPAVAIVPIFPFDSPFSLDMDGQGNGLLAWQDQSVVPFPGVIFTSFFDGTTLTWSAPVDISIPPASGPPKAVYSLNGTAAVLWSAPPSRILVSNFDGATWSAPPTQLSLSGNSGGIGIDDAGNALAVWIDDATGDVAFSFFTGGVWSLVQFVSTNGGNQGLSFAMSSSGAAVATWIDGTGVGFYSIFNGASWSTPLPFATDVQLANVAINSIGEVLIVWTNSGNDILSSFRSAGGVLGAQDLVRPEDGTFIFLLLAQLSDNRRGFSDWIGSGLGSLSAEGSFTNLAPLPPQSISGRSCSNNFATQSDRINIISWTRSLDPAVVAYYVRRNGVLVAIVPFSSKFIYFDHNRCSRRDVYTVVSVDAFGNESLPLEVTLR